MTEIQRRLTEWGIACRRESTRLGLPGISQVQVMIEHVRREDRLRKGVRRRRLEAHEPPKDVTARGKQTKAAKRPGPVINSSVLAIDIEISRLPRWMREVLIRSYLHAQADRRACQDLRLPKDVYRLRRLAAEEHLAERLALQSFGGKIPVNAVL